MEKLKSLLVNDPDPIDRHFMFSELEPRLYKLRDAEPDALADYDVVCVQHDAEMDRIRPVLHAKFGVVPLLETYKQQCVRLRKAKDFEGGLWWAQRGLALYGEDAGSQDWVDDLRKRADVFRAKLDVPATKPKRVATEAVELAAQIEVLTCTRCGETWGRVRVRGRKPLLCPACAGTGGVTTPS